MAYCTHQAKTIFIFLLCIVEVLGQSSCPRPPSIRNGRVSSSTSTSATYICNTGYQLVGSDFAFCEQFGLNSFFWDSVPTCRAVVTVVNCNSPPSIPNGSPRTPTRTTVGGTVTYTCNTGYQRSGTATVTCQANGRWSTRPICYGICSSPPSISNGSPGTPTSTVAGGRVTYTCNNGYQRSGSATVTCQASGSWSVRPTCNIISCGSPPSISNGSPGTPTSTTFGGIVTYTCNTGYQRSGQSTVTCQASESWNTRPSCTPVSCGNPPTIPNGIRTAFTGATFRGTATYACNTGYQRSGSAIVTCQASGSWSTRPTCNIISCGSPPSISNGSPGTPTRTTFGGLVTYICNTGYQRSGSSTVTCQANRSWTARPSCSPVSCGNPPNIPNGSRATTGTTFGVTATYTCNTGYQLSGPSTVTCQASRSWSIRPSCKASKSSIILEGTVAQHSCNTGYRLSGNGTRICNNNGIAGVWSLPNWSCRGTPEAIRVEVVALGSPVFSKNFSLLCSVYEAEIFQPFFTYKWVKDDKQLTSNSQLLSFDSLTISDAAEYRCEVTLSSLLLPNDVQVTSGSYELTFKRLILQVRFGGIHECRQYTSSETTQKTDDITATLVQGVTAICDCGFNSTFLSNAFLKCFADSPQHVTYRATLLSSSDLSTSKVLEYIEKWIHSTPSVIIQNLNLNLNATCPTVIADFNSLECSVQVPFSAMENTAVIVGSVIATSIIILVLIVVFAVVVTTTKKHRTKNSITSGKKSTRNVNTEKTEMRNVPPIPRSFMSLPSPPVQYKVPEATADPEYDEVGPPVVKGGENLYGFGIDPCPAYKQTLKNTHLK
ncbi:sushi, von Willebrand factor type A, EGF and pentraxin domain-containing protein 1-like [Halichondria panicea]|uniref:sushi, von Willebrand factor type A, EGF and pentraxin domain-containing protein 1-like n=1 Tax=Halichondria panicea TaxID=6063 RepID=UPI00312B87BB